MCELLKISHCDDNQRRADVIFIHDLDARDTWQQKNQPDTFSGPAGWAKNTLA